MAKNENLAAAKKAKNDEFYTQRVDIENELCHYADHFRGKTVYCNCDDPTWSEFWRFFVRNFKPWGLKKLIATHYEPDAQNYSYKLELEPDVDGTFSIQKEPVKTPLPCNGDFRSAACVELLQEADIVVTNPPFSLFREYVAQLMEYGKKFLVIGSMNAITYKEFFPLLRDDRVWIGCNNPKEFGTPAGTLQKFGNICWYTNLDIPKRHEPLDLRGNYYRGNEDQYPHYDNYDAIEVSKTTDIPCDYYGTMGVPISFLDKYCPEQFDIVGYTAKEMGVPCLKFYENMEQSTSNGGFVRNMKSARFSPMISYKEQPSKTCYRASNAEGFLIKTYGRIIIRRRDVIFVVVWAQTISAPKVRTFGQNVAWAQTVRKVA